MNQQFAQTVGKVVAMHDALVSAPLLPVRGGPSHSAMGGIYVLYENDTAVHVGRTRNLRRRLQGHCSHSHYQASFAFKRAREVTGRRADYRPGNSRLILSQDSEFRPVFIQEVAAIRGMKYRFLEIGNPIEQYLLELYTAMELGTSMDEFDTH